MRQLILGSTAAAVIALGISTVAFAAPFLPQHNFGSPDFNIVNVQGGDSYYWNHHPYHHRDWDRHHHRWHYYD
jgi:hypothetical protein